MGLSLHGFGSAGNTGAGIAQPEAPMQNAPQGRPPLLLTRPRAGSERFARQFRERIGQADWPVVIAPLLEIEPTGVPIPPADALIVTSEQAVAALSARPQTPVFCVGDRTAAVLRKAGFSVVAVAANAEALLAVILAAPDPGKLVHARGNESAFPLAERLRQAGRTVEEAIVYAQNPQLPSAEMLALLAAPGPVLLPVFSPNSGKLLAASARDARAELRSVAISEAAAKACVGLPVAEIRVAAAPNAEALLDVLVALACHHSG